MTREEIDLQPWEEIIGVLKKVKIENSYIEIVILSNLNRIKLRFDLNTKEGKIIENELKDIETGLQIGILKTNLQDKPVAIRKEGVVEDG